MRATPAVACTDGLDGERKTNKMILTKEQLTELETASQPLMDWMKDNLHPHTTAIVDGYHCELLEGLAQVLNNGPTQTWPPGWREPSAEPSNDQALPQPPDGNGGAERKA